MTTEITILEPQNISQIVQLAPQAYNENRLSHDRCIEAGQQLLQRTQEGMSDTLDKEMATYIERARKTVKKMNAKRSAVTQLFDTIRTAYTTLENEVDPAKRDTIPAQIQEQRNHYAAMKRAEQEAEQRRRKMEQERRQARDRYAAEVEADLIRQLDAHIASECNRLMELDQKVSLDNYAQITAALKETSTTLQKAWTDALRPRVFRTGILTADEEREIAELTAASLRERMERQYSSEVGATLNDILDLLPSKHRELERMAKADAEEAARIKAAIEEQERQEAARRERERREREEKEKAAAELQARRQEMDGLFAEAQGEVMAYQPKTQVRKRISVLKTDGFMQVLGLWWSQMGCTLTVEELEKIFSRQLTYCNKLANDKDNPILIQSEYIEYVDDIKAK